MARLIERRHTRPLGRVALGAAVVALFVTACTSGSTRSHHARAVGAPVTSSSSPGIAAAPTSGSSSTSAAPVVPPIEITASPVAHDDINPITPIAVTATNGTLSSVVLTNDTGKVVKGTMSPDRTSWRTTEVLGYGKTYTLVAKGSDSVEGARTLQRRFRTLAPPTMTLPYFQRMGGYALDDGATYGVGIVPVVHFDEPIPDKAAAQRALQVTTTPHVNGSWYWADDQDVHWRPRNFWAPGTKVTIAAKVYGVKVGPGLYGESDESTSFTIGRRQITIADDNAPKVDKVRVYDDGKLVRTMNTSMGKHSGEYVNGQYINFYTLEGTYTVLEHDNPAIMSSQSYGLPADAPGGYAPEKIYWSTKISVDGIYLHELNSTEWYQNNGYDVSHGCLNLTTDNATWFYNHSMIGDPVIVRHTGGPTIQEWEGGDWSVPWNKWVAQSAL